MCNSNYQIVIFMLMCAQTKCFPMVNDKTIVYDQRQSGKFNIQINIKDVAIVDLNSNRFLDETINDADEYYYDEDDLTVKPLINWIPTTPDTASLPSNETIMFNYTISTKPTIATSEDSLKQLVKKPVLSQQYKFKDNIPVSLSKRRERIFNSSVQRKSKSNSVLTDMLNEQVVKRSTGCKSESGTMNNPNCHEIKHLSWVKTVFGILQLMKTKDN